MGEIYRFRENFLVVKRDDVFDALDTREFSLFLELLRKVDKYRENLGKKANSYFVVNTDEPYAKDVARIMVAHGHYATEQEDRFFAMEVDTQSEDNTLREDLLFLEALQKELQTQDKDMQASPRFWVVGDYETVPCREGNEDKLLFFIPDHSSFNSIDELWEYLKEEGFSGEAQKEFNDATSDEEKLNWVIKHYDDRAEFIPVKKQFVIRENTMFVTKAEAQEHIELNRHHYSSEAHTYGMTAWRAPKVERLFNILETLDWDMLI